MTYSEHELEFTFANKMIQKSVHIYTIVIELVSNVITRGLCVSLCVVKNGNASVGF